MKTYYSIVSIATKPQLNEKFNVGLLCVTPRKTFFHYSEVKFTIVSKLLSANGRKLALSALKGIDEQINKDQTSVITDIFSKAQGEVLNTVSEPYVSYLSRYNNNLIQFSSPVAIDLTVDQEVYKALFKKYIYAAEIFEAIIKPKAIAFTTIRNRFRKAASPYANTNFNVNQDIIKDLIVPVTVDAFGKNGSYVAAQSIDFNKPVAQLQSEISSYVYLTEHTLKADKDSLSFVLGNEPSKKDKPNHDLWKSVCNASIIEFVPINESERIIVEMRKKGVAPVK